MKINTRTLLEENLKEALKELGLGWRINFQRHNRPKHLSYQIKCVLKWSSQMKT